MLNARCRGFWQVSGLVVCTLMVMAVATVRADDEEKPLFFFDTSGGDNLTAINGSYGEFAQLVEEYGFRVDHGLMSSISDKTLAGKKVLVLSIPAVFLYDDSKEALKRFIRDGGVVLIIGYSFPWTDYANLGGFTSEFGIDFGAKSAGDMLGSITTGSILSKPNVVSRLRSPFNRIGLVVAPSRAKVQATLDDGTVLTAIAQTPDLLGKGKLIVHGDASMFAQEFLGSYIDYENNREFTRNLLSFIAGQYDLTCTSVKPKGQQNHGKVEKAIVRIRNLGANPSSGAELRLLLIDVSSMANPTAAGIQVAKVKLPDIAPGTTQKVTVNYKIPGFTAPGEYRLVADIIPAFWPKDAQEDNNFRESKTFIVF